MSPLEQALATAAIAGIDEEQFWQKADEAMQSGGVVYSGADAFLIALDEGDCWFLWCAASDCGLARFFALAPYSRPFVAWERRSRGRNQRVTFPWERVKRACQQPLIHSCA